MMRRTTIFLLGSLCACACLGVTRLEAQRVPDLARSLAAALGAQGRVLWVDGTANLTRTLIRNGQKIEVDYTTTWEGVRDVVQKAKAARVNTLVVDVKPLSGQVLYDSRIAPRMREWKGRRVPDFDVLAAFVEEGHKAGLQVHACINVLSEGHKYFNVGLAYQRTDWQSIVYAVDRGLIAPNQARLSVRVPDEPDDPNKPLVLTDDSLIGSEDPDALTGLEESTRTTQQVSNAPGTPLGKQINVVLDAQNRVMGLVDSALLGDEPLSAPENGRLIPATRPSDYAWVGQNLTPNATVRFDFRTVRLPIAQAPSEKIACFVNPLHPEARRHELEIIREIVTRYNIDGFVLDRCRFSNLYNEFSDRTRDAFQQWLAQNKQEMRAIRRWPEDVFAFSPTPGEPRVLGPLFKPWLEFRAQVIRDLVAEIARTVRSIKPNLILGTYVGSWYPKYYEVGVNWGSEKTHLRYPWMSEDYPITGYAEFFDWISTGCYYPLATRVDARRVGESDRRTVEYAAELSNVAVASGAFVYPGLYLMDYAGKPEAFLRALEAAAQQGQGWMIFDLSHLNSYDWWGYLERATTKEAPAPHALPEVLTTLRSARDSVQ